MKYLRNVPTCLHSKTCRVDWVPELYWFCNPYREFAFTINQHLTVSRPYDSRNACCRNWFHFVGPVFCIFLHFRRLDVKGKQKVFFVAIPIQRVPIASCDDYKSVRVISDWVCSNEATKNQACNLIKTHWPKQPRKLSQQYSNKLNFISTPCDADQVANISQNLHFNSITSSHDNDAQLKVNLMLDIARTSTGVCNWTDY